MKYFRYIYYKREYSYSRTK